MSKLWSIVAAVALALTGAVGTAGAASAAEPNAVQAICIFQVTPAGAGAQILAPDEHTPVGTLQAGQIVQLARPNVILNNIIYWNTDSTGNDRGDWYPVNTLGSSQIFMQKISNPCGSFL